jgi:hypothetical protein
MRMTPEAFHTWSQDLQFISETEALTVSMRCSPCASGRANNITGHYPSLTPMEQESIQLFLTTFFVNASASIAAAQFLLGLEL